MGYGLVRYQKAFRLDSDSGSGHRCHHPEQLLFTPSLRVYRFNFPSIDNLSPDPLTKRIPACGGCLFHRRAGLFCAAGEAGGECRAGGRKDILPDIREEQPGGDGRRQFHERNHLVDSAAHHSRYHRGG